MNDVVGSEPTNALGKKDILRFVICGVLSNTRFGLIGSLESVR